MVGEDVQVDRRVGIGRALQNRADQARRVSLEHIHCRQRDPAHRPEPVVVSFPAEQLQVLADGTLDLGVARQGPAHVEAQPFRRLYLCLPVIANAVIDDDARRLLGEQLPGTIAPVCGALAHRIRTAALRSRPRASPGRTYH